MATFIIGAIVFGLLFLAIFSMVKKNKGGCGCGCSGCPSKKSCNSEIEFKHK